MWKRFRWAATCGMIIGAVGCFESPAPPDETDVETASATSCPAPVEDQAGVTDAFLEVLYPDSKIDKAIACRWTSADCSERFTHLSSPPIGTAPSVASCRAGTQPLAACYVAAVQLTLAGLNAGDASLLYEGAVRTRDVTLRAGGDDAAPLWLRSFGPANLLAKTFVNAGVAVDNPLVDCPGTADERYGCLANASRGQFRGLLALLDHHAGVLARNGSVAGASALAWKLVQAATAPVHARIVNTGMVSPKAGVRMNRIDLLGKYAVLRLLDGSAEEGNETELAHVVTRATYVPANAGAAGALFVPRFDILLAAGAALTWDESAHKPVDGDPDGAADVRALWRTVSHGITLASLQGRCALSQELQDLRFAIAALFSPHKFQKIPLEGVGITDLTTMDTSFIDLLTALDVSQGRACGWVTSEDYVRGWSETTYWYEYDSWDDCEEGSTTNDGAVVTDCQTCEPGEEINGVECDCDLVTYCVKRNIFGACTQEVSFQDCQFIVELEYSQTTPQETRIADAYTFVTSLRGAYRELMTYYDAFEKVNGAWVKRAGGQADGVYDLHYDPLAEGNATIALAYVDGEACDEELATVETAFGSTGTLTCEPGDICGTNHSALWPAGSWIPYPIATRLCPEAAGKFGGVLADDGSDSWCATPWDYTKAVAHDFLPNAENVIAAVAEEDALDGMVSPDGTWQAEDGEDLTSTLVEFFAETNLLSQPTAAMYLRKAQVAYSAGHLPNLAGNESLAADTLGLDTVEGHVDTGLEVMRKDFELMLDFYELEDNVAASSTPLMIYFDRPIPKLALAAMDEVYGGTVTNDYTSNRAMIYPRLGDALELHRELVRLKLDILWRRADGFNACIDTGVCDPTAATGCATSCGSFDDALAFTETASSELDAIDDMLASHGGWLALQLCPFGASSARGFRAAVGAPLTCDNDDLGDLQGYIARLRAHITGTQDELARAAASLQAGNDAFGFRGVNHYPGDDLDGRIAELVGSVRDMGQQYEGFVDDYLGTLADYTEFESAVASASTNASGLLAGFCVDAQGVAQPDGCAVDPATWTTSHALIAAINQSITTTLCAGDVVDRDTGESVNVMPDHLDDNGYTALYGLFEDYMTSLGLATSACPQLTAPDFAAWEGYGGSLAEDLHAMELVLEQLAAHLTRFHTELYAQATMAESVEVIQTGVDAASSAAGAANNLGAAMSCVAAMAAAVATEGAAVPAAVVACTNLVITAGNAAAADTLEELQMELDTLFANYSNLQNLMAIVFDIYSTLQQYDAAVQSFEAHRAQFLNLQTNIEDDYRNLYENAFRLDPTNLLFADERVESMALRFRNAMRDVRELEILVGYDLGAPIAEGRGIYLEDDYYFLPRLADITVAEHYGLADDGAYITLKGGTRPLDERKVTLVATATLLGAIHDAAQTLSGSEQTTHGFLSEPNASGFDAGGNPQSYTEWSLLRRSPFYNAWIGSDPSADDDGDSVAGTACGTGEVDLYYYCKQADGTPMVPENSCLAVAGLAEATRINLAWLDHQVVGIGAVAFTCTPTAGGYTIAPAVGSNGVYLDIEELNPRETRDGAADFDWYLPDFMETGTVTGMAGDVWYRGQVSQEFYDSQTPTVRRLMDDVFDMSERGVVSIHEKTFMPGSYLLGLHSSDSPNPNAVYDAVVNDFDLEDWGLNGSQSANDTFAERLEDISVMCTDTTTCAGADRNGTDAVEAHYARFFYSGPGYQSTVCTGASHQEKAEWLIDDRTTQGSFAIRSTSSNDHEADAAWMSARVSDPTASVKAGDLAEVPLQATLAVIQVFGLTDSDGVAEANAWVLHADAADEIPNLRIALRYRYYATQLSTNAEWSEAEGQDFYESVTTCSPTSTYPW